MEKLQENYEFHKLNNLLNNTEETGRNVFPGFQKVL
jgi:hypothetical protein